MERKARRNPQQAPQSQLIFELRADEEIHASVWPEIQPSVMMMRKEQEWPGIQSPHRRSAHEKKPVWTVRRKKNNGERRLVSERQPRRPGLAMKILTLPAFDRVRSRVRNGSKTTYQMTIRKSLNSGLDRHLQSLESRGLLAVP
jgi:hypothetical protein